MQRSVSSNRVMMSSRTHATMFFFRYVKSGLSRYLANSEFYLWIADEGPLSSSTAMITYIYWSLPVQLAPKILFYPCCAIAQAVSRWLPTAVAQVQTWVWLSGICSEQSDTGVGFLQVLRFPMTILIPSTALRLSTIVRAGTISQLVADVPSGLSLTPPQETKKEEKRLYTCIQRCLTPISARTPAIVICSCWICTVRSNKF
jgi:hypothetical protein